MKEVDSPRQINTFDCGIYVILYITRITDQINRKENSKKLKIEPREAGEYRKFLRQYL